MEHVSVRVRDLLDTKRCANLMWPRVKPQCMCSVECEAHVKQALVSSIVRSFIVRKYRLSLCPARAKREENWYVNDEVLYQSL